MLGKTESEHLISPAIARIRWILKDSNGNERDYSIETCPLHRSLTDYEIAYLRRRKLVEGRKNALDALTERQKMTKIGHLLSALKKLGTIRLGEKKMWEYIGNN